MVVDGRGCARGKERVTGHVVRVNSLDSAGVNRVFSFQCLGSRGTMSGWGR